MNVHTRILSWKESTQDQRIENIIKGYKLGHTNSVSLARWLSALYDHPLSDHQIREVYRRNKVKSGKLLNFPLSKAPDPRILSFDIDKAAKLWAQDFTTQEIATQFGLSLDKLYGITQKHRDKFPRRDFRPSTRPPVSHPERVTRYVNGWPITLPRVTFIDGKASQ